MMKHRGGRVSRIIFARGSSTCRHTLELNLLPCAVQGNHHTTLLPTELSGFLIEPRFDITAGKISRIAKAADPVSVRPDLNDAICSSSSASANTDDDADNDSEGPKNFHGVSISLAKKGISSASEVEGE